MTDQEYEDLTTEAVQDCVLKFSGLTLDELRLLEAKLQDAISDRLLEDGFQLEQELQKLHALAAEKGIKLRTSPKKVYPAKFRNPEPPHQEWSGRGRRPNWMRHYDNQFGDETKTDAHCTLPLPGLTPAE